MLKLQYLAMMLPWLKPIHSVGNLAASSVRGLRTWDVGQSTALGRARRTLGLDATFSSDGLSLCLG